jgi:hypothetical protein
MNSLAPETIDLRDLPSLSLGDRCQLPNVAALYFVLNAQHEVLYIGRAKSLKSRWRSHHRLADFAPHAEIRIAWVTVSDHYLLPALEDACLAYFHPPYNRCAAEYIAVTFRMPPDLLSKVRSRCDTSGAPLNTELIRLVEKAIQDDDATGRRPRRATPVGA